MQVPLFPSEALQRAKRRIEPPDFLLPGAVLLAAIPLLYMAATQFIEYDGYCYIFGAGQDHWHKMIEWYRQDPHPPLYYFFLRAALHLGRSYLVYRAVSVLAGLATIYLVGRAASKAMRSRLAPALTALTFGLAVPTLVVSTEVRAYMLCTFFILLSYSAFLDVLAREEVAGSLRSRIVFVTAAALACQTDYYAFFYVLAVLAVSLVLDMRRSSAARWRAVGWDAAMFAPVLGGMTWQYFSHLQKHAGIQLHLINFYYRAADRSESLGEYLLRGLRSDFGLFCGLRNDFNVLSPWPGSSGPLFLAILAGLVVAAGIALWLVRRVAEPVNRTAMATLLATGVMLAQLMVAGVLDKYPFGGLLRQQFLLFPFLVLCVFLVLDRLSGSIPLRARYVLTALLFAAILGVSYLEFDAYPKVKGPYLFADEMERFNHLFPSPGAVYLDRYNLTAFFIYHDDWKWKFDRGVDSAPDVDIYRVSRGTDHLLVFRDKGRWVAECLDPTLYRDLAACLRSRRLPSIILFRVAQNRDSWGTAEQNAYRQSISQVAASQGLCVENLLFHNRDVYEELRAGGCTAPPER